MIPNLRVGLELTVAGMGLVFLLLALLWGLMTLLLRLDNKRGSKGEGERGRGGAEETLRGSREEGERGSVSSPPLPISPSPPLSSAPPQELPPEMLAAIMVAVRMHRRIRRKQAAPAMRSHQPGTLPSRWIGAGRVSQNQSWHPGRR